MDCSRRGGSGFTRVGFFGTDRHIRRGGGRVVWSGDACVALAGGRKRSQEQDEDHASVPTPHPHRSRPYEYECASEAMTQQTYPCKAGAVGMWGWGPWAALLR